jgi:hypothetical protein
MTVTQLYSSVRKKISPDLTSAGYSDADILAALNEWYRTFCAWMMEAMGTWEYQGNSASQNLAANTGSYSFPTGITALSRVEINYDSTNDDAFAVARRVDDKQIWQALSNGEVSGATTSHPVYRLFAGTLQIFPIPTAVRTNGLFVEFIKDVTDLSTGTDVPNLNPLIHRGLGVGAAYDYTVAQSKFQQATEFRRQLFGNFPDDPASIQYQVKQLAETFDRGVRQQIKPRRMSFR